MSGYSSVNQRQIKLQNMPEREKLRCRTNILGRQAEGELWELLTDLSTHIQKHLLSAGTQKYTRSSKDEGAVYYFRCVHINTLSAL